MINNKVRSVYLLEEGEGGSVTEECEEEDEDEPVSAVEVEDGEGEGGSGRQGPVGGPPMNLTSPM